MEHGERLNDLKAHGKMQWSGDEHAWVAEPEDIVRALAGDGFAEYRREVARTGPGRDLAGGVWQGLDPRTGRVASAIWVHPLGGTRPLVFIDIDGQRIVGEAA